MSGLWGGWFSALIPDDSRYLKPLLPLLRLFDPDDIIALGRTPEEVSSETTLLLSQYVNPFRPILAEQNEIVGDMIYEGNRVADIEGYCSVAKSLNQPYIDRITNPNLTLEDPRAACWVYSHTGHLPEAWSPVERNGVRVKPVHEPISLKMEDAHIDPSGDLEAIKNIGGTPRFDRNADCYPFEVGLRKLAIFTQSPIGRKLPPIVVMGDTIPDFCLFYNLRRLHPGVYWLADRGVFAQDDFGRSYASWIISELESRAREKVLLTSVSVERDELAGQWDGRLERLSPVTCDSSLSVTPSSPEALVGEVPHTTKIQERTWRPPHLVPLKGAMSHFPINTPVPAFNTEPDPGKQQYCVDVSLSDWSCTADRGVKVEEPRADWITPARAARNVISYNPTRAVTTSAKPIQHDLRQPVLQVPEGPDMFLSLLQSRGVAVEGLSAVGGYEAQAIEAFGGLEKLAAELRNKSRSYVLEAFSAEEGDDGYPSGKVRDHVRYFAADELRNAVSDLDCANGSEGTPRFWDEWIDRGLLEQGFFLKCEMCRYGDWYPWDEITQTYKCRRCGGVSTVDGSPQTYWRLHEAVRQAMKHNSDVTLLALDSIRQLTGGSFSFSTAIKLAGNDRAVPGDIDLVCIADGELWPLSCAFCSLSPGPVRI